MGPVLVITVGPNGVVIPSEPTIADAILDRLVHNAYRIELRGDSLRRRDPTADPISAAPTAQDGR